jgi:peroxiredoxin
VQIPSYEADRERFEEVDTQVLGISVDSTATNAAWAESCGVETVPLLSDFWPHGQVAQQYGVLREQGFTERAVFVVDKDGMIRHSHIYDLDELPDNQELLDVLQDLQ